MSDLYRGHLCTNMQHTDDNGCQTFSGTERLFPLKKKKMKKKKMKIIRAYQGLDSRRGFFLAGPLQTWDLANNMQFQIR